MVPHFPGGWVIQDNSQWCIFQGGELYKRTQWCIFQGGELYKITQWCIFQAGELYKITQWSIFQVGELYKITQWCIFQGGELYNITRWWCTFHTTGELYSTTELNSWVVRCVKTFKMFRWDHDRLQIYKTSSWHWNGFPYGSKIGSTVNNIGEKPTVNRSGLNYNTQW